MGSKLCRRCSETKPIESFSPTDKWCRPCRAAYQREWRRRDPQKSTNQVYALRLKRDLGMSLAEYDALVEKQDGACAICRRVPPTDGRRQLHVDHDHQTGVVRALLCLGCNRGLGGFRDNPDLIAKAISYIEKWGS